MSHLIINASAIALLTLLAAPASADQPTRWYMAHAGGEPCIALDNIDAEHSVRLHYHIGSLHTPDDFMQHLQKLGATVTNVPPPASLQPYAVQYHAAAPDGQSMEFLFFNRLDICQAFMKLLPEN
jgi:hypothetical protein